MTVLQQEVYDAITRSEHEFGQVIFSALKREIEKEIPTWTDDECIKFLQNLMVKNSKRKILKQWWETNHDSDDNPKEIVITLKEYFGL